MSKRCFLQVFFLDYRLKVKSLFSLLEIGIRVPLGYHGSFPVWWKTKEEGTNRKREKLNESLTTAITLLINLFSAKHSGFDIMHDLFHLNATFAYQCEVIKLGHNTKDMEKRHLD